MQLPWADRLLRRLLQASMFVVALFVLGVISPPLWHEAQRASTWASVTATITESKLVEQKSRRGRSTCLQLKVITPRSGSDAIALAGAECFLWRNNAEKAQRSRYSVGASIPLLQDPDSPRQLALEPSSLWSFAISALLGLAALAYAIHLGQRPKVVEDVRWARPVIRTATAHAPISKASATMRTGMRNLVRLLQALLGVGALLLLLIAAMSWQERHFLFVLALSLLCAGLAAWLQRFVNTSPPRP